jgi:pyridoxine/pyridoxamine 5'-phosphate oxidase
VTAIRYLLDEHVDHAVRDGLRRREPEMVVLATGDPGTPDRGTLDPDLLKWCEAEGLLLVTNNRSTMPVHLREHLAAGHHIPGIFMLNPVMSIGETIDELAIIVGASEAEEYADRISFLPVT